MFLSHDASHQFHFFSYHHYHTSHHSLTHSIHALHVLLYTFILGDGFTLVGTSVQVATSLVNKVAKYLREKETTNNIVKGLDEQCKKLKQK